MNAFAKPKRIWLSRGAATALLISLLLVLLIPTLWHAGQRGAGLNSVWNSRVKTAEQPDPQQLAVVKRGEIIRSVLLDGELRAVRSRTIFADTSDEAKITWLPPEGTLVKVGDRLAELDSTAILTKIKDAEERLVTAENEVVRTSSQQEGQLRDFQVELSRLWLAYEKAKVEARLPADVLPRREYQEKQYNHDKAKTEYENQLAKIEQKKREFAADLQVKTIEKQKTENQLEQAKSGLKNMQIKAPAEGMVLYTDHWNERRKLQIGDVVWGGLPIVQLPDLTEMEVLAQVNEVDGPKISIGNQAKVILDSYPDIEISGTVKDISQTAAKASWQAKAKVFTVVLSLDRTLVEQMKPGMSAQVSVRLGSSGQQLLVPRAAAIFQPDSVLVTRLENEKERRPVAVTILAADALQYAVAANGVLREGDRILLRP
jgi:multidrug efflux pump subunit AcrA (membrane-fusion protein)